MDAEYDIVVIGGGIQGLLALEALQDHGYSTALVTDGNLGDGQTIHSHGFLNTGFGMLGDGLLRASHDTVQPYLRARGVEPGGEWRVIPPPGFSSPAPAAPLPDGFDEALSAAALASPDRNVFKRPLIAAISQGRRDSVVRGRAHVGPRIDGARSVDVHTEAGGHVRLTSRAVVVAAGCGSKQLLEELVGRTPQTDEIKHRRVHMICVRARHGVLPATSVVAMPLGLVLVAHDDGTTVSWYVTPLEFGGPAFDDVPGDASSVEDPAMLARGFLSLTHLYPRLRDVDGVQIGSYAGYREDIGDMPNRPLCEVVTGADDIVVALPSGLVPAWTNVQRILELVGAFVTPSGRQADVPSGGTGVEVGHPVEDRDSFVWQTVNEFADRLSSNHAVS